MTLHRHIDKIATRQRFCHGVFTRPRPTAVIHTFLSRCEAKVVQPIGYTIEKVLGEGKGVHNLADCYVRRIATKRLQRI
jgi:hypothetical protein